MIRSRIAAARRALHTCAGPERGWAARAKLHANTSRFLSLIHSKMTPNRISYLRLLPDGVVRAHQVAQQEVELLLLRHGCSVQKERPAAEKRANESRQGKRPLTLDCTNGETWLARSVLSRRRWLGDCCEWDYTIALVGAFGCQSFWR